MASEGYFPLFVRLPAELQAMVWEFARLSPRHIFQLDSDKRNYQCIDPSTGCQIPRLASAAGPETRNPRHPADGDVAEKHCLGDQVYEVQDAHNMHLHQGFDAGKEQPAEHPTFAWMNFERDVFAFKRASPNQDWLQFLAPSLGRYAPPANVSSHWFSKVEKLALVVSGHGETYLSNDDYHILRTAHALKFIYVVVKRTWDCPHSRAGRLGKSECNDDGFIPYEEWLKAHHSLDDENNHPEAHHEEHPEADDEQKDAVRKGCDCDYDYLGELIKVVFLLDYWFDSLNIKRPEIELVVDKVVVKGMRL